MLTRAVSCRGKRITARRMPSERIYTMLGIFRDQKHSSPAPVSRRFDKFANGGSRTGYSRDIELDKLGFTVCIRFTLIWKIEDSTRRYLSTNLRGKSECPETLESLAHHDHDHHDPRWKENWRRLVTVETIHEDRVGRCKSWCRLHRLGVDAAGKLFPGHDFSSP